MKKITKIVGMMMLMAASFIGFAFNANAQSQTIDFTLSDTMVVVGDSAMILKATATSGLPVAFRSEDLSVARVDQDSLIIVGPGKATIVASQQGGLNWNPAPDVKHVLTVHAEPQITIANPNINFVYNAIVPDTLQIGAAISGMIPGQLVYTSSKETIARVDQNGVVTAVNVGTAIITVSCPAHHTYQAAIPQKVQVTVNKAEQEIVWTPVNMLVNDVQTLTAEAKNIAETSNTGAKLTYKITPQNDSAYFFSEKNNQVSDITETGKLYAKRSGTITIRVDAAETPNYNPAFREFDIIATKADQTVQFALSKTNFTFGDADFDLNIGGTNGLPAAIAFPNSKSSPASYDRDVIYHSNNEDAVNPVFKNGGWKLEILAATDTETFIWASVADDGSFNTVESVRIPVTVVRAPQKFVDDDTAALNKMYTLDVHNLTTKTNQSLPVFWSVNTPETAEIAGTQLTVTAVGPVSISVYAPQTAQYAACDTVTYTFNTVGASKAKTAKGKQIFVQQNGAGKGDGSSAADATGILSFALDVATAGDSVVAAAGTFSDTMVNNTYMVNNEFVLKDGVSMTGGKPAVSSWNAPDTSRENYTTLDAQRKHSVMTVKPDGFGTLSVIEFIEFKNGRNDDTNEIGGLKVVHNMIVSNCYFYKNESTGRGGAILMKDGSVVNCAFVGCKAVKGGAIVAEGTSPRILNCFFYGNTATKDGGAIFNLADRPYFVNNTIVDAYFNVSANSAPRAASSSVVDDVCETINSTTEIKVWNTVVYGNSEGAFNANITPVNCAFKVKSTDNAGINITKLDHNTFSVGETPFNPGNPGIYAPDFMAAEFMLNDMQGYALDSKSILVNRGCDTIYAEAQNVYPVIDTAFLAKDILGKDRLQNGYVDIGAFESAVKGWVKIHAQNQVNVYNSEPQDFINFGLEPGWNADTEIALVEYRKQGETVWSSTAKPTEYGIYDVKITVPFAEPDTFYWNMDVNEKCTMEIVKKFVPSVVFNGDTDIEWDDASHSLSININSFYRPSGNPWDSADFTLTYTAPNGIYFNGAVYDPAVVTYKNGIVTQVNGTLPKENGVYTVTFTNNNPNYSQVEGGSYSTVMTIRPRVIHDEDIIISALNHVYDRTSKKIEVTFASSVTPRAPIKGVDYQIYYHDPRDPARLLTEEPTAVEEYMVVVEMFGDDADSTLLGHYKGEFTRTMHIVSDDFYAQNIPIYLGTPSKTSLLFTQKNEVKSLTVPVIALERIPAKGQKITIECSWLYASGILINSDNQNQSFDVVFDGKSKQIDLPLSLTAPDGICGNVHLKLTLSQFGTVSSTGLMFRGIDPASQKIKATIADPEGIIPDDLNQNRTGFLKKRTTVYGPQPVSVGLWVSKDNVETDITVTYHKILTSPSFECTVAPGVFALSVKKVKGKSAVWTLKAEKAGYYELLLTPAEVGSLYDGYRFFQILVGKTVENRNGKMRGVKKGTTRHVVEVICNNPQVGTLSAGFVVDSDLGFKREAPRYIAVTGGYDEAEFKNVNPEMIDIIDGVRLATGLTEDQVNKRSISIALPDNAITMRTASGAIVSNFSRRMIGYYLPSAAVMSDTVLARGYVDSVMVTILEAGAGFQTVPLYIHVGAAYARGAEVKVPADAFNLLSYMKRPTFKGSFFKPYIPYKFAKTQKTSVAALSRFMGKYFPQSAADVTVKSNISLENAKNMNQAWKANYIMDTLNADSPYQAYQRARLGVAITGNYKNKQIKIRELPVSVMMLVPPKVDSVYLAIVTRHNIEDQYIPGHGKYDMPAVDVRGNYFGDKPSVYIQYRNLKGKMVRVKGKILLANSYKEMAVYTNGGRCSIPEEIVPGKNGRLVVRFPKSMNDLGRLKAAGPDGRFDIVVESGNGVGGKIDIIPIGSFKELE